MEIQTEVLKINKLITSNKVGDWCRLEYPNHKKGCPNYNKKDICPPKTKFILDLIDTGSDMYFVYSLFNLKKHARKMKNDHPHWTYRQCINVLYWQNSSRKAVRKRSEKLVKERGLNLILECPEGCGVNVFVTARIHGIKLDKIKDLKICRHIFLVGNKLLADKGDE